MPTIEDLKKQIAELEAEYEGASHDEMAALDAALEPLQEQLEALEDLEEYYPERTIEQVQAELARARANYRSALMSDPDYPGWDRMCANLEDEVDDLERELEALQAAATAPAETAAAAPAAEAK